MWTPHLAPASLLAGKVDHVIYDVAIKNDKIFSYK